MKQNNDKPLMRPAALINALILAAFFYGMMWCLVFIIRVLAGGEP